jgi:hypothetical protein
MHSPYYKSDIPPEMEDTPRHYTIVSDYCVTAPPTILEQIRKTSAQYPDCTFHILAPGQYSEIETYMRQIGIDPCRITFYTHLGFTSKYRSQVVVDAFPNLITKIVEATTHDIICGESLAERVKKLRKDKPYIPKRIKFTKI